VTFAGSWRVASLDEPAAKPTGDHAYYFTAQGELVLSVATPRGVQRMLLTWKERDGRLAIDQPSAPREDVLPWLRASEHTMQLGGSWYVRETGDALDAEAPWWALVAAGAWYGIANAGPEPFTPFLMLDVATGRQLVRVVDHSSAAAEQSADRIAAQMPYLRGVWVRDGRVTTDTGKIDAVIATRFVAGGTRGESHALPYRLEGGRAVIAGGITTEPRGER
jgi:hypothetical protein